MNELVKSDKKELSTLSDFDFSKEFRARQYERQKRGMSLISGQSYGDNQFPKADKLMIAFNVKVKKVFGFGCDEIDKTNNAVLSMAIGTCREKAVQVISQFNETWDKSESHYNEFKRVLRELPVIEKQNLELLGLLK